MLLSLDNTNKQLLCLSDIVKREQKKRKAIKSINNTFNMQKAFELALEHYGNPSYVDEKGTLYWNSEDFSLTE